MEEGAQKIGGGQAKKWLYSCGKLVTSILMQITERNEENIPVVSITGDVDLETSPQLRDYLRPKASAKTPALLLDFSGVNYIDSSGLATLIEYFQSVQSFKGRLALAALSPRVKNVFEIVRLEQIFSIYPDVASALAAFKS
jgi:anti-sigma B factor antagonist